MKLPPPFPAKKTILAETAVSRAPVVLVCVMGVPLHLFRTLCGGALLPLHPSYSYTSRLDYGDR